MKKVLYVATVASHICQFHLPYLKMLGEMGYEVHVAAHDNLAEKNGLALKYTDKFFEIPFRRSPLSPKNLRAKRMLKKIIDAEGYEIIVCNTPVGGIVTRLAARGARRRGTRVIYIAHGFHFYRGASRKNWLIYYPIEKHFAKKCDALVTINGEDYELARRKFKTKVYRIHGVGVDGERYRIATNEEKSEKRREMGFSDEDFICLCVGELNGNKDQITAIRAVELLRGKHPQIRLLLAGNGPSHDMLENYICEKGLSENVRLLGYCTNLEEYQKIADVGISCSIREGLGLNVIEAQLTAHPFVAAKNRGHNELINDGVTGFLFEPRDYHGLAVALERLVESPTLCRQMASAALPVMEKYKINETLKEMKNILLGEG